MSNNKN